MFHRVCAGAVCAFQRACTRAVLCVSEGLYEGGFSDERVPVNTSLTEGMGGIMWCDQKAVLSGE